MTSNGSSNKKYGQTWKNEKFSDVTLPSGNVAQVRRPGVQGLIRAGVLESLDVLTGLVQQVTIPKAEGKPVVSEEKIIQSPETIFKMLDILDDIVLYIVHRPKVYDKYEVYPAGHAKAGERVRDDEGKFVLIPNSERQQDDESDIEADPIIYVDDVDLDDKMFLMNYSVAGSTDLATFRDPAEKAVGGVHDGEVPEQTTE